MNQRWESHPCACSFAKSVSEKDPTQFPRVGMVDNVLYRGHWLIRHKPTGKEAVICRPGAGALHAEADKCCFEYFNTHKLEPKT